MSTPQPIFTACIKGGFDGLIAIAYPDGTYHFGNPGSTAPNVERTARSILDGERFLGWFQTKAKFQLAVKGKGLKGGAA